MAFRFDVFSVNGWDVLVAGVVYFAIGAAWYMGFAKPWMKGIGKAPDELESKAVDYLLSLISEIGISFFVAVGINAFGSSGVLDSIFIAAILWAGFSLLPTIVHYLYESKTLSLLAINKGYDLVGMIAASIILTLWK